MKTENKKGVPALKLNEGLLKGGFKSLTDLQKGKVKAGEVKKFNGGCINFIWC